MAYSPGVQDISGQLLAQGINSASNSIIGGMHEYHANQEKDKAARGIVTGIISQNPDLVKNAGEETVKLLEKFKGGNTGRDDNVYLAGLLATAAKQKGEAQEQQLRQLQMQAATAQMAEQQRQMQFGKTLDQYNSGQGGGVLSAQMQNNPYFKTAAQVRQGTGQTPSANDIMDLQAKQAMLKKPDKNTPEEISLPSGAKVAFSPSTGAFSVLPETAESLGKKEQLKMENELNVKDAHGLLTDVSDNAEASRVRGAAIGRIMSLYDQGATTGFGQPVLTQAQTALQRVGLAQGGVANQQQLEKELNNLVMETGRDLMKGGGSVSNYERGAIEKATANANLTPEANKRILGVMKAIADRNVILDRTRIQMDDQGKSSVEIAKALRKVRDSMPVGVESLGQSPDSHVNDLLNKYK